MEFIVFDVGLVLIQVDFAGGDRALALLVDGAGGDGKAAVEALRSGGTYDSFMRGKLTYDGFRQAFCRLAGLPSDAIMPGDFDTAWLAYLREPVPGMETLLERLARQAKAGQGPRLAMLSNADDEHIKWCYDHLPAIRHIPAEHRYASCYLGLAKPDPLVYLEVARRLGTEPSLCLMIDDLEKNIEGARQAGMEGLVFKGADKLGSNLVEMGLL